MKQLLSVLLALIMCVSALPAHAEDLLDYTSDFTNDTDGWYPRSTGSAQTEVKDGALYISGRSVDWNSPGRGFELLPGTVYDISVLVKQDEKASASFMISCAHTRGGVESYENLASKAVPQGEWTRLSCAYTPGEFEAYVLYVETAGAASLSFGIKEFSVRERASAYPENLPCLYELYADYFDFGCAVMNIEAINTRRMDFYASQFNIMTPGNELKPDSVLDVSESKKLSASDDAAVAVSFDAARPMLDYCYAHGVKLHGHTLVWHSQTPEAFFHENYDPLKPLVTREVMLARLDNYIRQIMEYMQENYPGLIVSWDVVNEAVSDNSSALRTSNWTKVVGSDFVNRAFEIARRYAPEGTLLFYNDYSTPYEPKLTGICNLLDSLIAEGNIDGYGFQAHYQLTSPTLAEIEKALVRISAKGLKIRISELDIPVAATGDSVYTMQAGRYRTLMGLFMKYSGCIIAVHTWGVSDDLSWLTNKHPLLFDGSLQPKEAYWALVELAGNAA
ncbi:MAG: endo-1,4-beta-xylanase [Clostridia bacterium]|nr:endo-1,4-beta-xylanase [Clostridia bacterium]